MDVKRNYVYKIWITKILNINTDQVLVSSRLTYFYRSPSARGFVAYFHVHLLFKSS